MQLECFPVYFSVPCYLATSLNASLELCQTKILNFEILQIDWLTCFMLPEPWPSFLKVINHNHQEFYFLLASRPLLPWTRLIIYIERLSYIALGPGREGGILSRQSVLSCCAIKWSRPWNCPISDRYIIFIWRPAGWQGGIFVLFW